MPASKWVVWEWIDPDTKTPAYVGLGRVENGGTHPAHLMFQSRRVEGFKSPVMQWLQEFDAEPRRVNTAGRETVPEDEARAIYELRKNHLRRLGCKLFGSRPSDTYTGGGKSKAVISPEGDIYGSVRAAAKEAGLSGAEITRRCQQRKGGWRYLDDLIPEHRNEN